MTIRQWFQTKMTMSDGPMTMVCSNDLDDPNLQDRWCLKRSSWFATCLQTGRVMGSFLQMDGGFFPRKLETWRCLKFLGSDDRDSETYVTVIWPEASFSVLNVGIWWYLFVIDCDQGLLVCLSVWGNARLSCKFAQNAVGRKASFPPFSAHCQHFSENKKEYKGVKQSIPRSNTIFM